MRTAQVTLALVVAGAAGPAAAQRAPHYEPTPNLQFLTVKDGLPRELVTAVTQDLEGFMWFGTPSGLVRYDGHRMFLYAHDAPAGRRLSDSSVTALHVDKRGVLWVGTARGGVNRIDPRSGKIERVRNAEGLSSDTVTAIASGPGEEDVWVGTDHGLNHLDGAGRVKQVYRHDDSVEESLVDDNVLSLYAEKDTLWVGTSGGLDRVDLQRQRFVHYKNKLIAAGPVTSIVRDSADNLWIGTLSGLFRMNADLVTFHYHDPKDGTSVSSDQIRALLLDREGTLWIATDHNGLNRYNRETSSFSRFMHGDWINCLYQDREGTIWIGRQGYGLAKLAPASFHNYTEPATAHGPGRIAWDVWQARQGGDRVLWIVGGRSPGGLYRFDRKTSEIVHLGYDPNNPGSLSSNEVTRLAIAPDGFIWLGTLGGGVNRIDPKENKVVQVYRHDPGNRTSVPSDAISALAFDRSGTLWVGTLDNGLAWFDAKRDEFVPFVIGGEGTEAVFAIIPDPGQAGVLWLGTSAGVVRADTKAAKSTTYKARPEDPSSLADNELSSMFLDDKDRLWVGTLNGGLNVMDTKAGTFKRYGKAQGMASASVNCVVTDLAGRVWVATPAGLSRFDPQGEKFTHFDATDGIAPSEWTDGGCTRDDATSELFFASGSGLTVFQPDDVRIDETPPRTLISRLQRFTDEVPLEKAASTFSYGDRLTIDFAVLSYTGRTSASYRLEPLESDWNQAGGSYSASYNRLPPGEYRFRVKGANRHGVASDAEAVLAFRIPPPLWQTWWAYTSYAGFGLLVTGGFLRWQRRRIQRLRDQMRLAEAENDIKLVAAAQSWFLPKESRARVGKLEICGFYRPASKCGGDWWWYEQVPGGILILVGDVTGHGAGPAIMTAAIATTLRATRGDPRASDVPWRLAHLDREIVDVCAGVYQMAITAIVLDEQAATVRYYSAGGLPIISVGADGTAKAYSRPGTPLGSGDLRLGHLKFEMKAGDRFYLFTDGLTELKQENGRMLGTRRLMQMVTQRIGTPLGDTVKQIEEEALRLCKKGGLQEDDITFVGMEWQGTGIALGRSREEDTTFVADGAATVRRPPDRPVT